MKKIALFSMFGLAFMVLQVTNVGAQQYAPGTAPQYGNPAGAPGYAPGTAPQYGNPAGAPGYAPGTAPHLPLMDDPSASGSSYHLNQPVNQGGINGVIAEPANGDPCLMVAAGPNRVACYAALASQPRN